MSLKKKYNLPLAMFIIGMLIVIVGAYLKILHWQGANLLLAIGMVFEAIGLIILIRNLLVKKNK